MLHTSIHAKRHTKTHTNTNTHTYRTYNAIDIRPITMRRAFRTLDSNNETPIPTATTRGHAASVQGQHSEIQERF